MVKKLSRVRSLPCNNLHSDLCIMRTQDTFRLVMVVVMVAAVVGFLYFQL